MVVDPMQAVFSGVCIVTDTLNRGFVLGEAAEDETIIHVHIGMSQREYHSPQTLKHPPDPKPFNEARAGIPVTTQRRFDVYVDVAASEPEQK